MGMWHKKHRLQDTEAPPGKRLRDNITDLFASGDVPGDRSQSLLDDAADFARSLGSSDFQDLRSRPGLGSQKNRARDLARRLLRTSKWPTIYTQEIRCWDLKTKSLVPKKVCFLLPHEVVGAMSEVGDVTVLQQDDALDPYNKKRHEHILDRLQAPFVSISLWGDGIPFSWDRKRSADCWTISFPGLEHKEHRDLRICVTSVPHHWVAQETQEDILGVLAWSFRALCSGRYPNNRADGGEFAEDETWRRRRMGSPLPLGALIEMKGDWKQLHSCFALPGWMSAPHKPLCWRCTATKTSLRTETGAQASWLQAGERLSHFAVLERILLEGGHISPAFQIPFFTVDAFRIDWLHTVDQGVAPVYLGGLFHMILCDKQIGRNEDERCAWLWQEVQQFYRDHGTVDKLHNLTRLMIKPKKGAIELSGSAAQIRSLVPFGKILVDSWQGDLSAEALAARAGMRQLARCYEFLSPVGGGAPDTLLDNALAFHGTVVGLHGLNARRWQIRPKMHLFLELCKEPGTPASSWNYREESFGGSISHQSHHRGGVSSPLSMSKMVLMKFCAKEQLPILRA